MSLRDTELARRQEGRLELRPEPLRVRWNFHDLLTSDGHELRCTLACSVRAIPDPTERRMLEEVLLSARYAVTADDVAEHFRPSLRATAIKLAEQHTAAEWLGGDPKAPLVEALRKTSTAVAFACGVELLPPFSLDVESPTYREQRLRAMQQGLAEQRAAGQVEHFQRAAELLKQFQTLRASAPDLSPGRVLQQISEADRGPVLQTLLLASAKQDAAEELWAVSGPYLVRINGNTNPLSAPLMPLPPTLGPLRSVQGAMVEGQRVLLIGARNGFLRLNSEHMSEPTMYADTTIDSQLGFNRIVYGGAQIGFCGTHADAGLVFWDTANGSAPRHVIRPDRFRASDAAASLATSSNASIRAAAPGPRNLQVLDDSHLIFSVDGRLFITDGREANPIPSESAAEIVAIIPEDKRLTVVHEDCTLYVLDRGSREKLAVERRGSRIRAAGALPWLGGTRLLLAGDEGPISCVGFDDQLVTQYAGPHRGLRMIAGSTDRVVAVSADRQRLILWNSWDGRQPAAELYLTGLTKHRIADIDFG